MYILAAMESDAKEYLAIFNGTDMCAFIKLAKKMVLSIICICLQLLLIYHCGMDLCSYISFVLNLAGVGEKIEMKRVTFS